MMKRSERMKKRLLQTGTAAVLGAVLFCSSLLPFTAPLSAEASRIRRAGGEEAGADGEETETEAEAQVKGEARPAALSSEELKALSDSLDPDDCGFFLSTYTRPEEIRWEEVFYDGAGISLAQQDPDYAAAKESLLSMYGEQAGTLYVLRAEEIERFARRKTGVNYGLSRHPLLLSQRFTYLYDLDLYVTEHSDTNRQQIRFISGTREGDLYTLTYTVMDPQHGYAIRDFRMQALIRDGEWNYLSNLPAAEETAPRELALIDFYDTREEAEAAAGEGCVDATGLRDPRDMGYSEDEKIWYCVVTPLCSGVRLRLDMTDPSDDASFRLKTDSIYMPDEELYSTVLQEGEKMIIDTAMLWYPVLRLSACDGIRYGEYWFGEDLGLHLGLDADPLPGAHLQRYIVGTPQLLRVSEERDLEGLLSGAWIAGENGEYTELLFGQGRTITVRRPDGETAFYTCRYGELPAAGRGDPYTLLVTGFEEEAAAEAAEGSDDAAGVADAAGDDAAEAEEAPAEQTVRVSFAQQDGERTLTVRTGGAETVFRQARGMMSWQAGFLEVFREYAGRFDSYCLYAEAAGAAPVLILHRTGRHAEGEEYLAFRYTADASGDHGRTEECAVPAGAGSLPVFRAGTDLPILRYGSFPMPGDAVAAAPADPLPEEEATADGSSEPAAGRGPEPDAAHIVTLCPAGPELQAGSVMYGTLADPGVLLQDTEEQLTADGSLDADPDRDGRYEKILYMLDGAGERRIRIILHEQDGNIYAYTFMAAADETVTPDGFFVSAEEGTAAGVLYSGTQFFEYTVPGYDG